MLHLLLFYVVFRQSTPASYEHFTREALSAGETVRQRSVNLRSNLDDIYKQSLKDLRDQASRVDVALTAQINLTEGVCQQLEKELQRVRPRAFLIKLLIITEKRKKFFSVFTRTCKH